MSVYDNYLKVRDKWYNNQICPIVPMFWILKEDRCNTSGFYFKWLVFSIKSRDCFDFEIIITCSFTSGMGLNLMLLYLDIEICIPPPERLREWVKNNLWRIPKGRKC